MEAYDIDINSEEAQLLINKYNITNYKNGGSLTVGLTNTNDNGEYSEAGFIFAYSYVPNAKIHKKTMLELIAEAYVASLTTEWKNDDGVSSWESDSKKLRKELPALGRFFSVDPITSSYPELTPYQFASNTPIQAIDLDGLEAFIIHGTKQTTNGIHYGGAVMQQLARISGVSIEQFDNTFRWDAPQLNKEPDRARSARKLVRHVMNVRERMLKDGTITEYVGITLIGYSHGGNVSIEAARLIQKKYGYKVNILTISTPAYNTPNDPENPEENPGINEHIHIYHESDPVPDMAHMMKLRKVWQHVM